jgi:type I restriction enzyme, R subunit
MPELLTTPDTREKLASQIPAVELLMKLGFRYLPPTETLQARGGRKSEVILTPILREQLTKLNGVRWRGREQAFSPDAIEGAIAALRDLPDEGLIQTSEKVYDLLSLGKSFPQTVEGDTRSFTLRYVDWDRWADNAFHVTEEYSVERIGSRETYRVDLVLFVNGIPFAVIECKPRGKKWLDQGVSQHLRNQKNDGIPRLYWFAQLVLAVNGESARYATARTPAEFWSAWQEPIGDGEVQTVLNTALPVDELVKLFWRREGPNELRERSVTAQDRAVFGLCRPERLLELTRVFVVYDGGQKKVARHQQYAAVKAALARVQEREADGSRRGGLVWHTQGSGKSLTMVMLAKALALSPAIRNPRLILVTDRLELDRQICDTFRYCGYEPLRARDGKELRELIEAKKAAVITTIINKFERAVKGASHLDEDENLFVLVDEGHRTNFGSFHALMRKALPHACFIGFTGTPVVQDEKRNNLRVFGDFIHTYTLDHAVRDAAVVPLLYEGRHVEQDVDQAQLDLWFERMMRGKTEQQKADFKRKFATADHLNRADKRLLMIAYDLCEHFTSTFANTGAKGQLVAPRKDVALRYKEIIEEVGRNDPSLRVSVEVLISAPDDRDDYEDCAESELPRVQAFWREMMSRFGTEDRYNESLTSRFKGDGDPQIIIVVSKLLTGFDAPVNTVLYIDKKLTDHTLLQAIARVNRKNEGKDFGYIIDYYGILGDLNEALTNYEALANFDPADLAATLTPLSDEVGKLPDTYSDVWELFRTVKNKQDDEQFAACLKDQEQRDEFYARLSKFARTFQVAMSSAGFLTETPNAKVNQYRRDLKYFLNLRTRMKQRYSEEVDYSEYEKRIQTLIDQHVGATEVSRITPLVNIFDKERFDAEVQKLEGSASRADTIASRTAKTIREKWEEDPAFYERFSRILQRLIEDFRNKRISDAQYLASVTEVMQKVRDQGTSDLPEALQHRRAARAFYGVLKRALSKLESMLPADAETRSIELGLAIDEVVAEHTRMVNWTANADVRNHMLNAAEDCLLVAARKKGFALPFSVLDEIGKELLPIAEAHYHDTTRRQ